MPGPSSPTAWQRAIAPRASAALDQALREIDSHRLGGPPRHRFEREPGRFDLAAGRADRARTGRRGLLAGRRPDCARATTRGPTSASDHPLPSEVAAPFPLRPRRGRDALRAGRGLRSRAARSATTGHHPRGSAALDLPRSPDRRRGGREPAAGPDPRASASRPTGRGITAAEILAMPPERRWMRIWRFYSGCGIAMFEDVYRDL